MKTLAHAGVQSDRVEVEALRSLLILLLYTAGGRIVVSEVDARNAPAPGPGAYVQVEHSPADATITFTLEGT